MYGTFVTVDGRPALRFERRLAHPVDAVWRAVTEPGELAHWFPARVEVDLRVGGRMAFAFEDDAMPPSDGVVTELDAPRRFAFRWGDDDLRMELEPDGTGCRVAFTHVFSERDAAARDAAGWHVCLGHLERRLAGESPGTPPTQPTPEWRPLYDAYRERGLPSGAPVPDPA